MVFKRVLNFGSPTIELLWPTARYCWGSRAYPGFRNAPLGSWFFPGAFRSLTCWSQGNGVSPHPRWTLSASLFSIQGHPALIHSQVLNSWPLFSQKLTILVLKQRTQCSGHGDREPPDLLTQSSQRNSSMSPSLAEFHFPVSLLHWTKILLLGVTRC